VKLLNGFSTDPEEGVCWLGEELLKLGLQLPIAVGVYLPTPRKSELHLSLSQNELRKNLSTLHVSGLGRLDFFST
jgi:hypothetical protein